MGALFRTYITALKADDLLEYHRAFQEEKRMEEGCDTYAGHIGIMPDGIEFADVKPFPSRIEAEEYLAQHHSKWECAMAVPFKGKGEVPDKKSEKLIHSREKAKRDLNSLEEKIISDIRKAKSKNIGCKHCGSSVRRKYLRSADCPVCCNKGEFYSNTSKRLLQKKRAKITELRQAKINRTMRNTTCYVVGGYCAY